MPQDLDEKVLMSDGPQGPEVIQARDPMCEATGRKLVRAVEAGGGGGGGGLTDAELRAAAVPVSTAAGDAGLVALATAIAGASPKTLADLIAILGATSGAAVVTDANGTVQQYLRGLVAMAAAGTINVRVKNGASFDIPAFNYQAFTYIGATNNVATQVFKSGGAGGTTVATLTFAYVAAGAADDDLIASITQS